MFREHVYSLPEVPITDVMTKKRTDLTEVRVTYTTKNSFKDIAKKLGIMDDFKVWNALSSLLLKFSNILVPFAIFNRITKIEKKAN